ncbi:hypothetical protein COP2_010875 [Malus domestica]
MGGSIDLRKDRFHTANLGTTAILVRHENVEEDDFERDESPPLVAVDIGGEICFGDFGGARMAEVDWWWRPPCSGCAQEVSKQK